MPQPRLPDASVIRIIRVLARPVQGGSHPAIVEEDIEVFTRRARKAKNADAQRQVLRDWMDFVNRRMEAAIERMSESPGRGAR